MVYKVGFVGMLRLILYMVVADFLAVGAVVATFNWWAGDVYAPRTLAHRDFDTGS